jgi:hypothetical protein
MHNWREHVKNNTNPLQALMRALLNMRVEYAPNHDMLMVQWLINDNDRHGVSHCITEILIDYTNKITGILQKELNFAHPDAQSQDPKIRARGNANINEIISIAQKADEVGTFLTPRRAMFTALENYLKKDIALLLKEGPLKNEKKDQLAVCEQHLGLVRSLGKKYAKLAETNTSLQIELPNVIETLATGKGNNAAMDSLKKACGSLDVMIRLVSGEIDILKKAKPTTEKIEGIEQKNPERLFLQKNALQSIHGALTNIIDAVQNRRR